MLQELPEVVIEMTDVATTVVLWIITLFLLGFLVYLLGKK